MSLSLSLISFSLVSLVSLTHSYLSIYMLHSNWEQFSFQPVLQGAHATQSHSFHPLTIHSSIRLHHIYIQLTIRSYHRHIALHEDKEKKSSDCYQHLFYLQFFQIFHANCKWDMQTGPSLQYSIKDLPLACYQGWLICFRVPGMSDYAGPLWQRPVNPWPNTHSALPAVWVTMGGARDITHFQTVLYSWVHDCPPFTELQSAGIFLRAYIFTRYM